MTKNPDKLRRFVLLVALVGAALLVASPAFAGSYLDRAGIHSRVGRLRIGDLLHEWVHHDRNHLRQILANLQAFAWPHMGNAQRFSLP